MHTKLGDKGQLQSTRTQVMPSAARAVPVSIIILEMSVPTTCIQSVELELDWWTLTSLTDQVDTLSKVLCKMKISKLVTGSLQ